MIGNVTMIEIGNSVRVLYPDYAEGRTGIVEARESKGRWLIRLDPLEHDREPLILSLEETDFEVVRPSPT